MPERNRDNLLENMKLYSYQKTRNRGMYDQIEAILDNLLEKVQ